MSDDGGESAAGEREREREREVLLFFPMREACTHAWRSACKHC